MKHFQIESNQELWNWFYDTKTEEGRSKTSTAQYKPVLLNLESLTNKPFNSITVEDIQSCLSKRDNRNVNHLKGFFINAINSGMLRPSKGLMMYLIPNDYKKLVEFILEPETDNRLVKVG